MLWLFRSCRRSLSARRAWIEMLASRLANMSAAWSLSARRAWIEIRFHRRCYPCNTVALRKESVDRNIKLDVSYSIIVKSLSARRAWIEIRTRSQPSKPKDVALRKESVDRNNGRFGAIHNAEVALRKESVDRNSTATITITILLLSLSARRAWIEIAETT